MARRSSIRKNEPFLCHSKKILLQSKFTDLARQLLAFCGQSQALQHFFSRVVWSRHNAPLRERMSPNHCTTALVLSVVHTTDKTRALR